MHVDPGQREHPFPASAGGAGGDVGGQVGPGQMTDVQRTVHGRLRDDDDCDAGGRPRQRVRAQAGRHQVRGLIAFGIGLALTSGALALLHHADARNRANLYDPVSHTLVPAGTGSMPSGGYVGDRNNFAPRVGLAWMPGGMPAPVSPTLIMI